MRITTWNCFRGRLADKRAALARLKPDIVVLTEASRPAPDETDVLWFGEGKLGVAIYARPGIALRAIAEAAIVPCVYPVAVDGPVPFTLFGVWTYPVKGEKGAYRGAFERGLDAYAHLAGPRVYAGDFNGNTDFDRERKKNTWAESFDRLGEQGCVSAYHAHHRGGAFGRERHATHYFQWNETRKFHLDYCFVPKAWTIRSVRVGTYQAWAHLSDHRPVTVDVEPA